MPKLTLFLAPLFLLAFLSTAHAQETVSVIQIISGDELSLQDGRTLRLSGVKACTPAAVPFLEQNAQNHALMLSEATTDRYGRLNALAQLSSEKQPLQETLLRQGLAFVYPATGDAETLDAWLDAERAARNAKRGCWSDRPDAPAADAAKLIGQYTFVSGFVTKAERIKNKLYVDFGSDRRTSLTLIIAARHLRALKKRGLEAETWAGKNIRLRGWIANTNGPTLTLTDPHQLEILP